MEQRHSTHRVHSLQVHTVWITKYRYPVLVGDLQLCCREIIRQVCNTLDIQILKGVVSRDHIHFHVSYRPQYSISDMVKRLKGRSSRLLLQEFPELKRRYWGGHLWGIGYGSWSTGHITEEILSACLSHHRENPNTDENFILE
jgi:putative transposase